MEVVSMTVPTGPTSGPGGLPSNPFQRRDVREWSRIDRITGVLEQARLEKDHWAACTGNSSHQYGKLVDDRAATGNDVRARQRRQLEVYRATETKSNATTATIQVVRTCTSSSWSTRQRQSTNSSGTIQAGDFDNLQLAINPLDLSSQKTKVSVGRSGSIGGRRPPTRVRSITKNDTQSQSNEIKSTKLLQNTNTNTNTNTNSHKTDIKKTDSKTETNHQKISVVRENLRNIGKSTENSQTINNLNETKIRQKLDIADRKSADGTSTLETFDLELPKDENDFEKITKENGIDSTTSSPIEFDNLLTESDKKDTDRRLTAALRNNSIDLDALDQILKSISSETIKKFTTETPDILPKSSKPKRHSFITVESLKEVRGRLRRTSSPTEEDPKVEELDDGIASEDNMLNKSESFSGPTSNRVKSYVYGMESMVGPRKNIIGTGSLESRTSSRASNLINRSEDWYNRRKSYGFEQVHNQTNSISLQTKNKIESSTDSGICRSTELFVPQNKQIFNKYRDSSSRKNPTTTVVNLEKNESQEENELFNIWNKMSLGNNKNEQVTITIPIISEEKSEVGRKLYHRQFSENSSISIEQLGTNESDLKRHSIAVDESKYVGKVRESPERRKSLVFDDPTENSEENNGRKKKVEFCKTEVHFAAESGRVNIVETDEKPPPTNNFRRRRRNSGVPPVQVPEEKNGLPLTHFGDTSYEKQLFSLPDHDNIQLSEISSGEGFQETGTGNSMVTVTSSSGNAEVIPKEIPEAECPKGILKNKIAKPKPYLLGDEGQIQEEDLKDENGSGTGTKIWGVKLRPVQRESPPFWKSTVTVQTNVFNQEENSYKSSSGFQNKEDSFSDNWKSSATSNSATSYPAITRNEEKTSLYAEFSTNEDSSRKNSNFSARNYSGYNFDTPQKEERKTPSPFAEISSSKKDDFRTSSFSARSLSNQILGSKFSDTPKLEDTKRNYSPFAELSSKFQEDDHVELRRPQISLTGRNSFRVNSEEKDYRPSSLGNFQFGSKLREDSPQRASVPGSLFSSQNSTKTEESPNSWRVSTSSAQNSSNLNSKIETTLSSNSWKVSTSSETSSPTSWRLSSNSFRVDEKPSNLRSESFRLSSDEASEYRRSHLGFSTDSAFKTPTEIKKSAWTVADRVRQAENFRLSENKGYSTKVNFGSGQTTVVESDQNRNKILWPEDQNIDDKKSSITKSLVVRIGNEEAEVQNHNIKTKIMIDLSLENGTKFWASENQQIFGAIKLPRATLHNLKSTPLVINTISQEKDEDFDQKGTDFDQKAITFDSKGIKFDQHDTTIGQKSTNFDEPTNFDQILTSNYERSDISRQEDHTKFKSASILGVSNVVNLLKINSSDRANETLSMDTNFAQKDLKKLISVSKTREIEAKDESVKMAALATRNIVASELKLNSLKVTNFDQTSNNGLQNEIVAPRRRKHEIKGKKFKSGAIENPSSVSNPLKINVPKGTSEISPRGTIFDRKELTPKSLRDEIGGKNFKSGSSNDFPSDVNPLKLNSPRDTGIVANPPISNPQETKFLKQSYDILNSKSRIQLAVLKKLYDEASEHSDDSEKANEEVRSLMSNGINNFEEKCVISGSWSKMKAFRAVKQLNGKENIGKNQQRFLKKEIVEKSSSQSESTKSSNFYNPKVSIRTSNPVSNSEMIGSRSDKRQMVPAKTLELNDDLSSPLLVGNSLIQGSKNDLQKTRQQIIDNNKNKVQNSVNKILVSSYVRNNVEDKTKSSVPEGRSGLDRQDKLKSGFSDGKDRAEKLKSEGRSGLDRPDLIRSLEKKEFVNLSTVFDDRNKISPRNTTKTSKSAEVKKLEKRPDSPVYENIDQIAQSTDEILQELTKAADQILQAVNGYTDDDSKLSSAENSRRNSQTFLETITESKTLTTKSRKEGPSSRKPRPYKPTSSTSSLESLSKEPKPISRPTRSEKLREDLRKKKSTANSTDSSSSSSKLKARRLQRASSREALLQSHGSSSEDLPSNVLDVRKPRLVRRRTQNGTIASEGRKVDKSGQVSAQSFGKRKEEVRKTERTPVVGLQEIRHKTAVSTIRSTAEKAAASREKNLKLKDEKKRSSTSRTSVTKSAIQSSKQAVPDRVVPHRVSSTCTSAVRTSSGVGLKKPS